MQYFSFAETFLKKGFPRINFMKPKITVSPLAPVCWAAASMMMPVGQLVSFAAALAVHEAGHIAAIKLCGAGITAVRVRPAGLELARDGSPTSYAADAAISLAGPAASILTGAACLATGGVLRLYGVLSMILGLFNALPVIGLDGGAALTAALACRLAPDTAGRIARAVSMTVTVILWVASVGIMLTTGGSFTLFAVSCLLFASQAFGEGDGRQ